MGGSAAKFRGFWAERGCGATIQHTADTAGAVGRKNFFERGEKGRKTRKIGVREGPEGGLGAHYVGCAGQFLGLEARPLATLLEVCFV